MDRHSEIMNGNLSIPQQVIGLLNCEEPVFLDLVNRYWNAIWHSFLNEDSANLMYWAEVFGNSGYAKLFTQMNYYLEKLEWTTMEITSSYASISLNASKIEKWVSKEELLSVRRKYKFKHYKMQQEMHGADDLVKVGNSIKKTGLIRTGFQKAGTHKFYYDSRMIKKHQKEITEEVTKKIIAGIKDVDYKEIVKHLITEYTIDCGPYTLGPNVSDSRGRAIFDCTKRVFNPISHKTARASVMLPKPEKLTDEGWKAIYLFVAELNHIKTLSIESKAAKGKELAENETISKKCDLHERIWLERIYENIKTYETTGWTVPIEADCLASGICMLGIITNDHHFLDGTNVIGDELKDIWTVPGLPRDYVKKAITPILYGSSQTPEELWDSHDFEYTQKQVNNINKELLDGRFKNVLRFREFIINNVKPKEKMKIDIWGERFDIYCNRFKWDVTTPVKYSFLNKKGQVKDVVKETALISDLNAFKTYFVTLLIF